MVSEGSQAPLLHSDSGLGLSGSGRASRCSGVFLGRQGTAVEAGTSVWKAPTGWRLGVAIPADIVPV